MVDHITHMTTSCTKNIYSAHPKDRTPPSWPGTHLARDGLALSGPSVTSRVHRVPSMWAVISVVPSLTRVRLRLRTGGRAEFGRAEGERPNTHLANRCIRMASPEMVCISLIHGLMVFITLLQRFPGVGLPSWPRIWMII